MKPKGQSDTVAVRFAAKLFTGSGGAWKRYARRPAHE
jgi:hypothetical protein